MAHAAHHIEERYTYGDYAQWVGDERWELIDGVPYLMSPAPLVRHQLLLVRLVLQIGSFLKGKRCQLLPAPIDIRLPDDDEADEEVRTVVQPDIVVICDPARLDAKGGRGAPDFVIEILSPSTSMRDRRIKADLYEKHGVREYWIVDPDASSVTALRLGAGRRWEPPVVFGASDRAPIAVLPGLVVDLAAVFAAAAA